MMESRDNKYVNKLWCLLEAADGANRRETEYADSSKSHIMPAGKVNSQRDLREALNEWDANDPENDAASRASGDSFRCCPSCS